METTLPYTSQETKMKSDKRLCHDLKVCKTILRGFTKALNRGSHMSAHILLNLLNKLGKEIICEACGGFSQRV